jgi:hypothetical protein
MSGQGEAGELSVENNQIFDAAAERGAATAAGIFLRNTREAEVASNVVVGVGAGARAFQHLVDAVQRCIDTGAFRPVDPVLAATGVWAAVHGVTSLLISMPGFPWPDVETLVDHVCSIQNLGLSRPVHEDQGETA